MENCVLEIVGSTVGKSEFLTISQTQTIQLNRELALHFIAFFFSLVYNTTQSPVVRATYIYVFMPSPSPPPPPQPFKCQQRQFPQHITIIINHALPPFIVPSHQHPFHPLHSSLQTSSSPLPPPLAGFPSTSAATFFAKSLFFATARS